jgi:hypothetical protein
MDDDQPEAQDVLTPLRTPFGNLQLQKSVTLLFG